MKKYLLLLLVSSFCFSVKAQVVTLEPFASGFSQPIDIQTAGDDRLFVVEQGGVIKILNSNGTTNTTPFLNISGQTSAAGERGLLGLAFHPDYANNGYFFVNYSLSNGDNRIARFTVSDNPDVADASSELNILTIQQPFGNHNGGSLNFDPSGFLVISSGDGGSGGDPGNRAQNTSLLLGKLLRIDIDNTVTGGLNYTIPADNPFAGSSSEAQEIWAYGIRNAWKFSFDSQTNEIWIADVGQNAREEINKMPGDAAGLNYGWRCYEGNSPFNTANCPPMSELIFPEAEYNHSQGQSITGGYVYRGNLYPDLVGFYFFADFASGIFGSVDQDGSLTILDDVSQNWSTFGRGNTGELYIAGYGGSIFKLVGENLNVNEFNQDTVQVFPNPATNSVTITSQNQTLKNIQILSLEGRLIQEIENSNTSQTSIVTSQLTTGIYLLKIQNTSGAVLTRKLVIK